MTAAERIDRHFAERLVAVRARAELTPAELAQRAGMTQPRVKRIENGTSAATVGEAILLAAAVGVAPSELMLQLAEVTGS